MQAGGTTMRYFSYAYIDAISGEGAQTKFVETGIDRTGETTAGSALALPGSLQTVNVYFLADQGMELNPGGATVTSGQKATTLFAKQAEAPRIFNTTWASGKPGSAFKLQLVGFADGWALKLTGDDTATGRTTDASFGTWDSPGPVGVKTRNLTIPKAATPGYTFYVRAHHTNGSHGNDGLVLWEPFQVCTLNPTSTAVSSGGKLGFSGRVPFQSGKTKRVLLYQRSTAGAQPLTKGGFTSSKGWSNVASATANGSGKYAFRAFSPQRTAWYCVWYPGDAQHWGAWTSVVKVTRK